MTPRAKNVKHSVARSVRLGQTDRSPESDGAVTAEAPLLDSGQAGAATNLSLAQIAAVPTLDRSLEDLAKTSGTRLPFLLKVLAVAAPLSLQVHPDAARAAAGFAAENAAGLGPDADAGDARAVGALIAFPLPGIWFPAGQPVIDRAHPDQRQSQAEE